MNNVLIQPAADIVPQCADAPVGTFGIRRDAAHNRPSVHCGRMAPKRIFLVPHATQVAWAAARPFFRVTAFRSADSVFSLHLTQ